MASLSLKEILLQILNTNFFRLWETLCIIYFIYTIQTNIGGFHNSTSPHKYYLIIQKSYCWIIQLILHCSFPELKLTGFCHARLLLAEILHFWYLTSWEMYFWITLRSACWVSMAAAEARPLLQLINTRQPATAVSNCPAKYPLL